MTKTLEDLSWEEIEAAENSEGGVEALLEGLGDGSEGDGTAQPGEGETGGDGQEAAKQGESADEAGSTSTNDDDPDQQAQQDDNKATESKPAILTRDGKHFMPYEVLEGERREKAEMKRQLDEMAQRLQAFEQRNQDTQQNASDTTDTGEAFDLQAFVEEYGEDAARPYLAMQRQMAQLQEQLGQTTQWQQEQQRNAEVQQELTVEEAIDAVFSGEAESGKPSVLRQWQQNQDPLWDAATALDARLQADPDWQHRPMKERFEEVVRLLGHAPDTTQQPSTDTDPRKAAEARLKEAEGQQQLPSTLSDLPGGEFTDQTAVESVERMAPGELTAKFAGMTDEQVEDFLSRL